MAEQLSPQSIKDAALQPKSAADDAGSVTSHSISDQIKADRYAKSAEAAKTTRRRGLRISRASLPNALGQ